MDDQALTPANPFDEAVLAYSAPKPAPEPVTITLPAARIAEEWSTYGPDGDSGIFPAEDCAACPKGVQPDQPMRQIDGRWVHEACAIAAIETADVDAAWLLLADQLTARPSAFRASDVKVIVRNVAAIARRLAAPKAADRG